MGKTARNSLKGYTYQTYILTLFLALMDTKRNIRELESECLGTKQFDDIFIKMKNSDCYRVQVKNYPGVSLDDITVTDHIVTIRNNTNEYNPEDTNIIIINTDQISTDIDFMEIPATKKNDIVIIPITQEIVEDILDSIYQCENRELQIILKAYELTCAAHFLITESDLPELITLSNDLANKTVLLRNPPECFNKGINYITGKPGIGKSHYVEEIIEKHKDAIIYRFWIGAHDENLSYRLQFDNFLADIGMRVFKSPRSFSESELAKKLVDDDILLIIDGLDHVENYNFHELTKFISFLNLLDDAGIRTVVLSRPMQTSIPWESKELIGWNFHETSFYLATAHNICSYDIQKQIYEYTDGYPIITYFLAEHFNKFDELNLENPIGDINKYYDELLKNVKVKSTLCAFASNNSFFTTNEIKSFFMEPEIYDIIREFIFSHPYLFEIVQNRISLVHDSFNTYLRNILAAFPQRYEIVKEKVQKSLLSYEVEYMDRISSFNFDKIFLNNLLIQYSEFDALKKILSTTLDYNSITSFYLQLQRILEKSEGILDQYQYYSFSLIYQVVTRNDLFGCEGLVYQILLYLSKHSNIENNIFSSGLMWNIYLMHNDRQEITEKFILDSNYSSEQYDAIIDSLNSECNFFECMREPILYDNIEDSLNANIGEFKKSDLLLEYLVSTYMHGAKTDTFRTEFLLFLEDDDAFPLIKKMQKFNIEKFYIKRAIKGARYRLHELGAFGKNNMFRSSNLLDIIVQYAPRGSFEVVSIAQSYIRLANHEDRSIDINSVNFVWTMYAQRKDYSVHTLGTALILFEEYGLITELESIEILNKLINQSEKGIRLLLSTYINNKGKECVKRILKTDILENTNYNIDIFDLTPSNINCLPISSIQTRMIKLFESHYRMKTIDISEIKNVLQSKYRNFIFLTLSRYGFNIIGAADKEIVERAKFFGINIIEEKISEKAVIPFENGYIHDLDIEYIKEKQIPIEEWIKYADGWYSCMPFLELFEMCDKSNLKENYLLFLHKSLFSRVIEQQHIGNWNNMIGNIPRYIQLCNVDTDWNKMFEILKQFFDVSFIYYPQS